jgi:stage II sporulation protein D
MALLFATGLAAGLGAADWEEPQGGRSHASGGRPELGPTHPRPVMLTGAQTLRVGLTPTSFAADGTTVLLEYWTAVAHNHPRVEITATGPYIVVDDSGQTLVHGAAGQTVSFVRATPGGLISFSYAGGTVQGESAGPLDVRLPTRQGLLVAASLRRINRLQAGQLTAPPYRGQLRVSRSEVDPSALRLINVVSLEPYVAGVVVNESLSSFHVEALKAQAITARGYALANLGRFESRGFDIDDSTLSQVYRGQSSETAVALAAQQGTLGLVLIHAGQILSALYSSSMGGHTESNEYVFPSGGYPGTNAHPALRGIHDGPGPAPEDLSTEEGVRTFYTTVYPGASEVSPSTGAPLTSLHRWTRSRSAAELLARLKESFGVPASATRLDDLATTLRGHSGRMMRVVATGDWGSTMVQGWSDLRRLATVAGVTPGGTSAPSAPNSPSTYAVTRDGGGAVASVLFYGGGFGHNVGMSQYGSQGRALRGQDAETILTAYYTATEVAPSLGTPPTLLAGQPVHRRFRFSGGRAVLVLERTHGVSSLTVSANGKSLELHPRPDEPLELDVTSLLVPGANDVEMRAQGQGVVSLQVRTPAQR